MPAQIKTKVRVAGGLLVVGVVAWYQCPRPASDRHTDGADSSSSLEGLERGSSEDMLLPAGGAAALETVVLDAGTVESLQERVIRISVVDSEARAIPDAALLHLVRGESSQVAVTDVKGSSRLPASIAAEGGQLMAKARGHATGFVDLAEGMDEVHIVLGPEGTLAGQVQFLGGERASAGIRVAAIPREDYLTWDPDGREAQTSLHGRSGITDELGAFRIEGLHEGKRYRLEAAGEGAVVRSGTPVTDVRASAEGIVLEIQPLWGVVLHFWSADEAWLASCSRPPSLETTGGTEISRIDRLERRPGPSLFGVPQLAPCEFCRPLLYLQRTPGATGPHWIEVKGSMPGFEPFWTQVELRPLVENRLHEHRIELQRNSPGLGTLRLMLDGPGAALLAEEGASAHLSLERLPRGQVLEFPLRWEPGARSALLEQVPAGNYRWSLSFESGLVRIPAPATDTALEAPRFHVDLDVGATVEILVPTPSVGFLEVECHTAEGPVVGSIELRSYLSGGARGTVHWMRGITCTEIPQRIGPLEPGAYGLRLVDPAPISKEVQTVEVEAGVVREMILVAKE